MTIEKKPLYTAADVEGLDFTDSTPGSFPFIRGPRATMYAGQPWTTRGPRPLGDATVAEYAGKPGSHKVENTGKSAYQLFAVENLKASGWTTAPAATGLATKLLTEARAFRIYDVRLVQQTAQTSHTHSVPTIAVATTIASASAESMPPETAMTARSNPTLRM